MRRRGFHQLHHFAGVTGRCANLQTSTAKFIYRLYGSGYQARAFPDSLQLDWKEALEHSVNILFRWTMSMYELPALANIRELKHRPNMFTFVNPDRLPRLFDSNWYLE